MKKIDYSLWKDIQVDGIKCIEERQGSLVVTYQDGSFRAFTASFLALKDLRAKILQSTDHPDELQPDEAAKNHSALDKQIGGDHYQNLGVYQPIKVMEKWLTPEEFRGYIKGTVLAYLCRERHKGKDDDLKKALHTLQLWEELNCWAITIKNDQD